MNLRAFNQQKRLIPSFILMVMVAAFALKAIIPAGFMPETKNGFMELVICSGMGEKTVLVPMDDAAPSEHQDDKSSKDICSYQVLSSGQILVPVALATLPAPTLQAFSIAIPADGIVTSAHILSFEARGPPAA